MRLLILGHSVLDYVEQENNVTIQPGGIFYTAVGFACKKRAEDKLFLLTSFDGMHNKYFEQAFSPFDLAYSLQTKTIPIVHLQIWKNKERTETFENFTDKLLIEHIPDFSKFDGIFINMISGNDISVDDILFIRNRYNGTIFMDVHALSKESNNNGERIFCKVPKLEKWLSSVDIIQANEFELNTISEGKNQLERARFVLNKGPKILIVTKGNAGVRAFFKRHNEMASIFISAEKVNSVNKIGCGDIFGAIFFYSYIESRNLVFALKAANKAASISTTYNSHQKFLNLKNDFIK